MRIWRNWQTRMIQVHVVRAVQVQVLLSALNIKIPNLVPIGNGFGFLVYFDYPNFNSKIKYYKSICITNDTKEKDVEINKQEENFIKRDSLLLMLHIN